MKHSKYSNIIMIMLNKISVSTSYISHTVEQEIFVVKKFSLTTFPEEN